MSIGGSVTVVIVVITVTVVTVMMPVIAVLSVARNAGDVPVTMTTTWPTVWGWADKQLSDWIDYSLKVCCYCWRVDETHIIPIDSGPPAARPAVTLRHTCLLYTSDAADE